MKKHGTTHYYQRNNKVKPNIACNVTSFTMCLDILGQLGILNNIDDKIRKQSDQPEDWLYLYLSEDPAMIKFLRNSHGTTEIPAPEWADCLIQGANTLAKWKLSWFDSVLEKNEILDDLKQGLPVNVSTTLYGGHRIAIVGCKNEEKSGDSLELLVSDPWLKTAEGGIRYIKWPEFVKIRKPYGIRFNHG